MLSEAIDWPDEAPAEGMLGFAPGTDTGATGVTGGANDLPDVTADSSSRVDNIHLSSHCRAD